MANDNTPKSQLEPVLMGAGNGGHIPLSIFPGIIYSSEMERELRNRGVCLVDHQSLFPYKLHEPKTEYKKSVTSIPEGGFLEETVIETQDGYLTIIDSIPVQHPLNPKEFMPWREKFPFSSEKDYPALITWIINRNYTSDYERFKRISKEVGDDFMFIPWLGYSPVQELIINLMGIERFSFEWAEHRDKVGELMEVLSADLEKKYPFALKSDIGIFALCGNITPSILGPGMCGEFIFPHLNRFGKLLHQEGKRLLCHFDGGTKLISDQIRDSEVDIIEAFTLPPEGDMTLVDAVNEWENKVISIHIPGSFFKGSFRNMAEALDKELDPVDKRDNIVFGITETLPKSGVRWGLLQLSKYLEKNRF